MLFSEKLKSFKTAHPCEFLTVGGARFRYMLCGRENGETLVLLNGGMNTLEMWMDYVDALAEDARVLLFDYPQQLKTNQELVTGMHAFLKSLAFADRFSSARATAAWFRRFTCRNIPAKPAD